MSLSTQFLLLLIPYLTLVVIMTTPLKEYQVPIMALVTFCYLLSSFIKQKSSENAREKQNLTTSAIILFLVLSVITLTGGVSSLFFFLLYFVAFLLAFTALPETVFVYAACTVLFFLFMEGKGADSFSVTVHLLSVVLLSPLAFFFGKEYQEQQREKAARVLLEQDTTQATEAISDDVKAVLEENRTSLSNESIERLNDILEETEEIKDGVRSK